MIVSYRKIEQRYNTQTDSVCSGHSKLGPFNSEDEAWSACDEYPRWGKVIKVHQDTRGWWAVYMLMTTTLLEEVK